MSDTTNIDAVKRSMIKTGIYHKKTAVTHTFRYTGMSRLREMMATRDEIMRTLHHKSVFDKIYDQTAVPWIQVLKSAGFKDDDNFVLGRASVDMEKLWPIQFAKAKRLIFPGLEDAIQVVQARNASNDPKQIDVCGENQLLMYQWLRVVFLQDLVFHFSKYSFHTLFQTHPFFRDQEMVKWFVEELSPAVLTAHDSGKAELKRLGLRLPDMKDELVEQINSTMAQMMDVIKGKAPIQPQPSTPRPSTPSTPSAPSTSYSQVTPKKSRNDGKVALVLPTMLGKSIKDLWDLYQNEIREYILEDDNFTLDISRACWNTRSSNTRWKKLKVIITLISKLTTADISGDFVAKNLDTVRREICEKSIKIGFLIDRMQREKTGKELSSDIIKYVTDTKYNEFRMAFDKMFG